MFTLYTENRNNTKIMRRYQRSSHRKPKPSNCGNKSTTTTSLYLTRKSAKEGAYLV